MAMMPMEYEETSTYIQLTLTGLRDPVTMFKKNGMVNVNLVNVFTSIASGSTAGTVTLLGPGGIPKEYRPRAVQTVVPGYIPGSAQVMLEIRTDGSITAYNYGNTITTAIMYRPNSLTYIAAD